jgi:glycosyltransferase involved in cell wall biosynthesis
LVLVAPQLSQADYELQRHHLGTVTLEDDGVLFMPAHPVAASAKSFWLVHARQLWRQIRQAVSKAAVVHSGVSDDIWRPLMAMVNLAAWWSGRPVVFFVDIDFRKQSQYFYQHGIWSLKSYMVNRLFHDPLRWLQVWLSPRLYSLVLLKSPSMVEDFGKGRANVKNFFDTVHCDKHILSEQELTARINWLQDPGLPFQLIYFGRLVPYKGLDKAIQAVQLSRAKGYDVRLTIIGEGPCLQALRDQAEEAHLGEAISFLSQVGYGSMLFEHLRQAHVAIATPLSEDTPRSAFDAMARGLPVVAFDLPYFRVLAEGSGAVALARWPVVSELADTIMGLCDERSKLSAMAGRGIAFARDNTQQAWLRKRTAWTLQFALSAPGGDAA